ncbi:carboxypeptidase-like regulatory domain-containing protein [Salinimicrobium flavum]|uniref:Carboxypeptidase-like regulatory domain-containing protein n=1 Tax=Salinimicrobium flavum TaxID=1737065 RepID=A0ABW5IVB1_9FLAO
MRFLMLLAFFIFGIYAVNAQEVRGQVLDSGNKQPIPYASVLFGENRGVVTNEEGVFSFTAENPPSSLKISSMGYETVELKPEEIINGTVYLKPASIELREVYLSNKNLSPKEIIAKVKEEIDNNYDLDLSKKRVFYRESNTSYVKKFDLEVDKSTIEGIDQNLMDQISQKIPKVSDSYKEVLADLYGNYDSQKLEIIKAANLYDPQSTRSLEELTDQLEMHFKQSLKEKSYLKIRSGIIGVKVDSKELQEGLAESSAEKKEKTPAEKEEEHAKDQENLQKRTTKKINSLLGSMFWKEDITFNLFEKSNKYNFSLDGYAWLDNSTVYVLSFEPKRGADYKGKIYVNTLDYGVHRLEFSNVKPLKKFKLFGISTADDVHRGKMIFVKDVNNKYTLNYLEQERGESFGLDRPLTIIEKNKHVKGRRKQNELDLDLRLNMSQVEKVQLVVYENQPLDNAAFQAMTASGNFQYETFRVYNPNFWQGNNIMEPNAAIKKFTSLQPDEPEEGAQK